MPPALRRKDPRTGKGPVKAKAGWRPPSATLPVTPTRQQLQAKSVTTDRPTRSAIRMLPGQPLHTYTLNEFQKARDECRAAVRAIIQECEVHKRPFFDKTFYYDDLRCVFPPGTPSDCTVTQPQQCKRLTEIYGADVKLFSYSDLADFKVDAQDILQGAIGDCWLIAAISGVATHCEKASYKQQEAEEWGKDSDRHASQHTIERLFVLSSIPWGVHGVMLFKMGQWHWVIVDDLVAVDGKAPLFAQCRPEAPELWPCILEKAYAKMHGNWDALDGGFSYQGIVSLSGGVARSFDLYGEHKSYSWKKFSRQSQDPLFVIGCGVGSHVTEAAGPGGPCGETQLVHGLVGGHAYSVLSAYEVGEHQLVQVRNPWGESGEWTGPWSDHSKEWKQHPKVAKELEHEARDDGTFWMSWRDFRYHFSDIEVVRYFPTNTQVCSLYNRASNPETTPQKDWYILHVSQRTFLVVTLGQTESGCADVIQSPGLNEEARHNVVKGDHWPGVVSRSLSVRVASLGDKCPTKLGRLKALGAKPLPGMSADAVWRDAVYVETSQVPAGYYAIHVDLEPDTQYYVRVYTTYNADVT
eukprot:EG_transcript_7817